MDLDGYRFVENELGKPSVYPGHPLTIGVLIMKAFPSFDEASKPEGEWRHSAASRSSMIPGAGECVASAVEILRLVVSKTIKVEDAIDLTDRVWASVDDNVKMYPARWSEGQAQADALKSKYVELLNVWK